MEIIKNPTPEDFYSILEDCDVPLTFLGDLWRADRHEISTPDMPETTVCVADLPVSPSGRIPGHPDCMVESFWRTHKGWPNGSIMHESEGISQEWLAEILDTDSPRAWNIVAVSHPCDGDDDTLDGWVLLSVRADIP